MHVADYRRLFQILNDAVILADAAHRIRYLNPSAEALLQYSTDVLRGQPLTVLGLHTEQNADREAVRDTESEAIKLTHVYTGCGRTIPVEYRLIDLTQEPGMGAGMIAVHLRPRTLTSPGDMRDYPHAIFTRHAAPLAAASDVKTIGGILMVASMDDLGALSAELWLPHAGFGEYHLSASRGPSAAALVGPHSGTNLGYYLNELRKCVHQRTPVILAAGAEDAGFILDWMPAHATAAVLFPIVIATDAYAICVAYMREPPAADAVAAYAALLTLAGARIGAWRSGYQPVASSITGDNTSPLSDAHASRVSTPKTLPDPMSARINADAATAETTPNEQLERLLRERSFLEGVLQNLNDCVVACDADGNLIIVNQSIQDFYALPGRPTPPARWAEHYDLFLPDGVTRMTKEQVPLFRALTGEDVRDVEMVIAPKCGRRRVVMCNGHAIYNRHGQKLGAVVAMHDITAYKRTEARLTRLALRDPLTGLTNRRALMYRLRRALQHAGRPSSVALLFLDLDNFKIINDRHGHEIGDRALGVIAERLLGIVRAGDTVARLGGDEFVVLCENLTGAQEAIILAQRIEASVAAPLAIERPGLELTTTVSVGIAFARDGDTVEDLLREADAAMYRAKQAVRARLHLTNNPRSSND